jgi:hypothetical protein
MFRRKESRKLVAAGVAIALALTVQTSGVADVITFTRITNDAPVDVASQMWAILSSVDATHVQFEFHNLAVVPSSITDIYFDDGGMNGPSLLAGIMSIVDHGTLYEAGASPHSLPAGHGLDPIFLADFSAQSDSSPGGTLANGVNSSTDYVDLIFALNAPNTYGDVLAALDGGALRLGLHVQGISWMGDDASDSFVSTEVVPEPSTLLLAGTCALGFLGFIRRRSIR